MKRIIVILVLLCVLAGCSPSSDIDDGLFQLRQRLSQNACQFIANIRGDFGTSSYDFSLLCTADQNGDMIFSVQEPETIAGITGQITSSGGKLTFDEKAVAFALLADGELTPVSAPWLMIKGLRGGFLSSWSQEGSKLRLRIDDSYQGSAMLYSYLLDDSFCPLYAEIIWEGRCILSVSVEQFRYL